jgi:hypothetical protein
LRKVIWVGGLCHSTTNKPHLKGNNPNPSRLRVALRRPRGDRAATTNNRPPRAPQPPLPPEEAVPRRTAAAGGHLLPKIEISGENPPPKCPISQSNSGRVGAAARDPSRRGPWRSDVLLLCVSWLVSDGGVGGAFLRRPRLGSYRQRSLGRARFDPTAVRVCRRANRAPLVRPRPSF